MAMTPEGRVKRAVSDYLKTVPGLWYDMPVPSGFGGSTLDYIGCYRGRFFSVETKAPGKKPTPRQQRIISQVEHAGGVAFVIDSADDTALAPLRAWVDLIGGDTR